MLHNGSLKIAGDPSRGRATRVGPEPDGGGREEAGAVHEQQRRPGRSRHIRNLPPSPPGLKLLILCHKVCIWIDLGSTYHFQVISWDPKG